MSVPHYEAFIPLTQKNYPLFGIYGRVTYGNSPIGGVSLQLRFYNGSTWSTAATTTTGGDGKYAFLNAPGLFPGQYYYVLYDNPSTTDSSRLCCWATRVLNSFPFGGSAAIGDFDIANISLQSPPMGAMITVDIPFEWGARAGTPSDSYELNLFNPYNGTIVWYSPHLGFVSSYKVGPGTGLVPFTTYGWFVGVYSPDGGYGESFYARLVTFDNSVASPSKLAPLKPRNIPELPGGRRLPRMQPAR